MTVLFTQKKGTCFLQSVNDRSLNHIQVTLVQQLGQILEQIEP